MVITWVWYDLQINLTLPKFETKYTLLAVFIGSKYSPTSFPYDAAMNWFSHFPSPTSKTWLLGYIYLQIDIPGFTFTWIYCVIVHWVDAWMCWSGVLTCGSSLVHWSVGQESLHVVHLLFTEESNPYFSLSWWMSLSVGQESFSGSSLGPEILKFPFYFFSNDIFSKPTSIQASLIAVSSCWRTWRNCPSDTPYL